MATLVEIINGTYNLYGVETSMAGQVFELVKPYTVGRNGGFIVVDGSSVSGFPQRNIRIRVGSPSDYVSMSDDEEDNNNGESVGTVAEAVTETDEQIKERLRNRFNILTEMTKAVKRGDVNAMIVSGAPGVGKSHGIEEVMHRYETLEMLGMEKKHEFVKGNMSAIGLYVKLYNMRGKDNVIIFDDCDGIFEDVLTLNILKAALDSKPKRTINWNTDSFKLRNEGVPDSFTFEGSAIFITNAKFSDVRSKKLKDHLAALESRCHYLDLTIDTHREKMLRIEQVIEDGMMTEYGFDDAMIEEVMEFVTEYKERFRELSLRTVVKLGDLVKAFPTTWRNTAQLTLMK